MYRKLNEQATNAGFTDVSAFVEAVADRRVFVDALPGDQLAASLKMIRKSEADVQAGRFRNMREAMLEIGEKHGFSAPE